MTLRVNGEEIPEAAIEYELARLIKFYSGHMSEEEIRKQVAPTQDEVLREACRQARIWQRSFGGRLPLLLSVNLSARQFRHAGLVDEISIEFFKTVQNKMHWAITGMTAAEIIHERVDSDKTNMGLTSWRGAKVRKQDVTIAKNYLSEKELLGP